VSTLYLVATPIGNLEDISARALRILREVSLIAAENTRQTNKLLEHYGIHDRRRVSYHEHNKEQQLNRLLTELEQGDVALVSDAGTPALNDPGYELVRAALDAGHQVTPIPGPSAPVAALVASGLPTHAFLYLGYLPRKQGERRRLLQEIADLPYTLIFLEAPHRLLSAFKDLEAILGDREVAVAREMTKLHEEIFRGTLSEASRYFGEKGPRGEFTLVLAGQPAQTGQWPEERVYGAAVQAIRAGGTTSEVAREIAAKSGWTRRKVYDLVISMKGDTLK
jgi:16S rRNA (cytidine1402-2'-O)-methyltransferase